MYKKICLLLLLITAFSNLYSFDSGDIKPEELLLELSNALRAGGHIDYKIVSDCITFLMEHGDGSAYPALFSVLTSGYPEVIAEEAAGALDIIPGNLFLFLLGVIENNPPAQKYIAFKTGFYSQKLTLSEKGHLAELALEKSFAFTNALEDADAEDGIEAPFASGYADLNAMRYASIRVLARLKWKRANPLAIRHYYRTQADFMQNEISKDRLIEAIECLGAVGDSDAALVLVLQLGLINARMERTGVFDPEITAAIVQALGDIGDNAAFDNLLFAGNLPYGEDIASMAAESIARLKWQ